ncbi:hypothetical protein STEG23_021254, partial [Scotinomys teguina]
ELFAFSAFVVLELSLMDSLSKLLNQGFMVDVFYKNKAYIMSLFCSYGEIYEHISTALIYDLINSALIYDLISTALIYDLINSALLYDLISTALIYDLIRTALASESSWNWWRFRNKLENINKNVKQRQVGPESNSQQDRLENAAIE